MKAIIGELTWHRLLPWVGQLIHVRDCGKGRGPPRRAFTGQPCRLAGRRVYALERAIRRLGENEVRGRLEAIAVDIGGCPPEERVELLALLGERMIQLGFRRREIREMLGQYPELRGEDP